MYLRITVMNSREMKKMREFETAAGYTDETMWFSSDELRMVNRILKLKEDYPDDVVIKRMPDDNDGCIYANMPSSWFHIAPPRRVTLSEEAKRRNTERLLEYSKGKKKQP